MNETLFQTAVVFIPGLIWVAIVDTLTVGGGEQRPAYTTALRAFGFGVISYFLYFTGYFVLVRIASGSWPTLLDQVKTAPGLQDLRLLRPRDILGSSLVALLLAIAWSFAANRKWFLRAMQRLGVTHKFGDESVWDFTLNLRTPAVEYAHVRDFEHGIIYAGYIRAFSEGHGNRELLLEGAIVYDLDTAQEIFKVPLLYLSRKPESMHVEYPYAPPLGGSYVTHTSEGGSRGN